MPSIKAFYENGHLTFPDGFVPEGRMEVLVIFPDSGAKKPPRDQEAGIRFVREWTGILKGDDLNNWKDEKTECLKGK